LDLETKVDLIKRPPTEEILVEDELRQLLQTNEHPGHYIGFEISGLLHLGNLIISGFKINDLMKAGVKCQVYLADWHSFINDKFGGDWDKILMAAKYYEKAFKFFCPGVKIVLGSDLYHNNDEYWRSLIKFSKHMTISRSRRCMTIMGRSEFEKLDLSQYFYAPMQAVDVKAIGADIPHGGMDQRKAHVLAREVFPKMGWQKPVALHHHLLMGIAKPATLTAKTRQELFEASKMSKSKPWTAIFIHDREDEIRMKLKKAWCPERQVDFNPILDIVKYIIFHERQTLEIERHAKYGGRVQFNSYMELEKEYMNGKIHPQDLKNAVAKELAAILEPIRKYFETDREAKECLETVKTAQVSG
jgi:tyrosyl-tRNA synthetase